MFLDFLFRKDNEPEEPVQVKAHDFEKLNDYPKLKDFVAIDFETAKALDPCQIGMAIVKDGTIVQTVNHLIRPIDNEYMRQAIAIHHITPDMTENEPSFPEVWEKVKAYFEGAYIVAHNADFDINVLRSTLDHYGIEHPHIAGYICTCDLNNRESLELACARYGIALANHHDGEDDAINCAKLYLAYANDESQVPDQDIPDYIKKPFSHSVIYEGHTTLSGDILVKDLTNADPANPFYNRKVVISGLFDIDREELAVILKNMGADIDGSVGARTNFLIAGREAGPSKVQKAHDMIAEGKPFRIIFEDDLRKILAGQDYDKYRIDLPEKAKKEKEPTVRKTTWPQLVEKYKAFVDGEDVQFTERELESEDYRLIDLYYRQQQKVATTKATVLANLRQLDDKQEAAYRSAILACFTEGESLSYEEAVQRMQAVFDQFGIAFAPRACVVTELGIEYELFKVKGLHHWTITRVPEQ